MARRELTLALNALARTGPAADADLLARFAAGRDEAAFATLVARHGPLVFATCRRVLGAGPDAEDAFQATFLTLALRAGAVRRPAALGGWLYEVARRTALTARRGRMRRQKHERAARPAVDTGGPPAADLAELQAALDEELARLSKADRLAFVLCHLDGRPRAEVANELGCREGTLSSRLARARARLQQRLLKRGVSLSAALTASALSAEGAVPPALAAATAHTAVLVAAAGGVTAAVPAAVASLLRGTIAMSVPKSLSIVGLFLIATASVGWVSGAGQTPDRPAAPAADPPRAAPVRVQAPPPAPPATDKKPAAPFMADQFSGVWTGEKDGIKVTVDARPGPVNDYNVRWIVEFTMEKQSEPRGLMHTGCSLRAVTDATTGGVRLDFKDAAFGRVDRDAAGKLFLSVLPDAVKQQPQNYRAVDRIPLTFVEDEAKAIQGWWRVTRFSKGTKPTQQERDAVAAGTLRVGLKAGAISFFDNAAVSYEIEEWGSWDTRQRRKEDTAFGREIFFQLGKKSYQAHYTLAGDKLTFRLTRVPAADPAAAATKPLDLFTAARDDYPMILEMEREKDPNPPADDAKAIQGTWTVVEIQQRGADTPEGKMAVKEFGYPVIFTGDKVSLTDKSVIQYRLDPTRTPKGMDFVKGEKVVVRGIYDLSGDDLKFRMAGPRGDAAEPPAAPKDFDITTGNANSDPYLVVLKRAPTVAKPAASEVVPVWGNPVNGVRVGVAPAAGGRLAVALENVGPADAVLNLGVMLANGKKQYPTAVRLTATDAAGKAHALAHKGPGFVGGRVDPFVVPLPAGGRYTLSVSLADFAGDDNGGLPAGAYKLTAEVAGKGVGEPNADMKGLALIAYWSGTAGSGETAFTVPAVDVGQGLEGTWEVTDAAEDGKPAREGSLDGGVATITADRITVRLPKAKEKGHLDLKYELVPGGIDLREPRDKASAAPMLGVFERTGDTLRLAFNTSSDADKRPTSPAAGKGVFYLTLKKAAAGTR